MQAKNAPRYQQIAADIAAKIAGGEYKIGDKIDVVGMLEINSFNGVDNIQINLKDIMKSL